MKWSVGPALIVVALSALSAAAAARVAHAAVGDAGDGDLLGGPDQPTYSFPPAQTAPVKRTAPVSPRPVAKAAPPRRAQAEPRKPTRTAQSASPVVRPALPAPPQRTAQVTPPAPWRSATDAQEMPQVASPEIPPEEEEMDVASDTQDHGADLPEIANEDRPAEPPIRERAYADPESALNVTEQDFARAEQAIERGVQRGSIGRREAQYLFDELDDIAAMRQDFLRGGTIGDEERGELADRFDALRDRINGAGDTRWRGRRY